MAYGRYAKNSRGFSRGTGSRNYVRLGRKKRTARTEYRKLRKAPAKKVKYAVAANKSQIDQLSRVVNRGKYQKGFESAKMVGGSIYNLAPNKPFCWAANDFSSTSPTLSNGGQIFGATYLGTSPNMDTSAVIVGNWRRQTNPTVASLKQSYDQWAGANDDTVSLNSYTPLKATYTLSFTIPKMTPDMGARWIRVDILKPKKLLTMTAFQKFQLPDCLGALSNMALAPNAVDRNKYNTTYWSVKSKFVKIPQCEVAKENVQRVCKFDVKFPNRQLKLDLQAVQGGIHQYEPFWANCDPRDIVWIVVSINAAATESSNNPVCEFSRTIHFRDGAGVST